jgi:hypothetical protein
MPLPKSGDSGTKHLRKLQYYRVKDNERDHNRAHALLQARAAMAPISRQFYVGQTVITPQGEATVVKVERFRIWVWTGKRETSFGPTVVRPKES